ncbi:MAG: carboxypeptidase-like regulatory domain-containing protein [Acidobacteriota bacterium]
MHILLLLLLVASSAPLAKQPGAELRLTVHADGATELTSGQVVLEPLLRRDLEPLTVGIPADGVLVLELPAPSSWMLTARLDGWWAPTQRVTLRNEDSRLTRTLELEPAGMAMGRLTVGSDATLPERIHMRVIAPPGSGRELVTEAADCPVEKDGRFACVVPAGTLDLALRAGDFVPHYKWQVPVVPRQQVDLGSFAMVTGASLAGWVEVEGPASSAPIHVSIAPWLAPGALHDSLAQRLREQTTGARANEDGFFQISGVPAGTYVVTAERDGLAPSTMAPIEVWPDGETLMRAPIVMRPPIEIELVLEPARDWRDEPWHVRVQRINESGGYEGDPVFNQAASKAGIAIVDNQAPGNFLIVVNDSLSNPFLFENEVSILSETDASRRIELDLIHVTGEVLLDDEPIEGTVTFGGRFGPTHVSFDSNEDGEFSGWLPRDGEWRVLVDAPRHDTNSHVITDVRANREGEAKVEIELPDTYVFGHVVDESGERVKVADVTVFDDHGTTMIFIEEDGSFSVRALAVGTNLFRATGPSNRSSDHTAIDVIENAPIGPIELTLRNATTVGGRVQSYRGPVVGATIALSPVEGGSGDRVKTAPDGTFHGRVAKSASSINAIVSPPGFPLKAFTFNVDQAPVTFYVSDEGGTIEVELPETADGLISVLWQDGIELPSPSLSRWARAHGVIGSADAQRLVFPRLAQGAYRVCLGPRDMALALEPENWLGGETTRCDSGFLSAGGTLNLAP